MEISNDSLMLCSVHELQRTIEESPDQPEYEIVFSDHYPVVEPNIAYGQVGFQQQNSELKKITQFYFYLPLHCKVPNLMILASAHIGKLMRKSPFVTRLTRSFP